MPTAWLGIAVLVLAAAFLLLGYATGLLDQVAGDEAARFTALLALLIVIGGGVMAGRDMNLSTALRQGAVWLAIGTVLVVLYGWRDEIAALFTTPLG